MMNMTIGINHLVIQDSTGGIMLLLDGQNLFQDYPIGTLIRLRLKDLLLSDYRRMIQLVGAVDSSSGSLVTGGIPFALIQAAYSNSARQLSDCPITSSI